MSEWMNKRMDGWMDGWMDRRTDGQTDGQTDSFTGKRSVASMMKQFIDSSNGFDDKR